jgi:hypothetical protein
VRWFSFNIQQSLAYYLDLYIAKFQSIFASIPNQLATVSYNDALNISDDAVQNYLDSLFMLLENDGNIALTVLANFQDHLKYISEYVNVVDGSSAELFTNVRVSLSSQLEYCNYYLGYAYLGSLNKAYSSIYNCYWTFNALFTQFCSGLDVQISPLATAVDNFNWQLYGCNWSSGSKIQCAIKAVSELSKN